MPAAEPRVLGECGGKSFVEDDMIRFMQQRAGRRARISAVASRLLTEEGDLTGRRLPRIDQLRGPRHAAGRRGDGPCLETDGSLCGVCFADA